jgi:uncharacterized coiled-coil DUF342 family protein
MASDILFDEPPEDKPEARNLLAEVDTLKAQVKELRQNVVWLRKAITRHHHTFLEGDTSINAEIEYDPNRPEEYYDE